MNKFREQAEEEKQVGIQGQWQLESPAREYLEQVKCCHDTYCMKQAFLALKGGDWEEYKSILRTDLKAARWAFDRTKEAFEKVAKDAERKLSTVQVRITCGALSRQREEAKKALRCHTCARTATVHRWKSTFGGFQGGNCIQLVVCDLWRKI